MAGGWLRCRACRRETSVTAGTIFEGTRKPLRTWFLAMWFVTSQKNGVSALGLQRALGLGSYETSWTWLHKLRRAMVRPGRDRLVGEIEADETYVGGPEEGKRGREVERKAIVAVAAEKRWRGIGRIRLRRVKDVSAESLLAFLQEAVEPGRQIHTDGWKRLCRAAGRRLPPPGHGDKRRLGTGSRGHATRPQSRRLAQTVVVGDFPGRHPAPTSRLLPRRIHFSLQSTSITGPWTPVPPPRPAGGGRRTGPLPPPSSNPAFPPISPNWVMKGIPTYANSRPVPDLAVFVCGQFFPVTRRLYITLADAGITIPGAVSQRLDADIPPLRALHWALTEGHTTKRGTPGGVGLKLVRTFVERNRGELQIASGRAFWRYAAGAESFASLPVVFPGTAITLGVNTDEIARH